MLEVVDKGSATDSHPVPLLFVHGAWHGAWCWDEHFLDFFAVKGFRAVAPSLRGHGGSALSTSLNSCSLADYVDDECAVADELGCEPVLIGHSLGCFIVQKYLETHEAPATVLIAPATPRGLRRSALRMFRSHPWKFLHGMTFGDSVDLVNIPALAREFLFCEGTPEPIVESCAVRMESESTRAGMDTMFGTLKANAVTTSLLVLGAEQDGSRVEGDISAVARSYRTGVECSRTWATT